MNPPQTKRQPFPLDPDEIQQLLKKRHRLDLLDPFAIDPDSEIRQLGRIALRRDDINDLFALGDLCARQTLTDDDRLLIFYAGKTLMAYRRAVQNALNDGDRQLAHHAIRDFTAWVIEAARQFPSRRNLAVALWVAAEDDFPVENVPPSIINNLLQRYRDQVAQNNPRLTFTDEQTRTVDDDHTQADLDLTPLSDASMTVADLELDLDSASHETGAYVAVNETQIEDSRYHTPPMLREAGSSDSQLRRTPRAPMINRSAILRSVTRSKVCMRWSIFVGGDGRGLPVLRSRTRGADRDQEFPDALFRQRTRCNALYQ